MLKKISYAIGILIILILGFGVGIFLGEKQDIPKDKNSLAKIKSEKMDTNFIPVKYENNQINFDDKTNNNIPTVKQEPQEEEKQETPVKKVVKKEYHCPVPEIEYGDMWLLPISQEKELPDASYIPSGLEVLQASSRTRDDICLTKEAKEKFEQMTDQAASEGIIIKASSGFRTYETQQVILANQIKNGNPNATIAVAKAGYSEHQLGTAVDITGQSIKYISASKQFDKSDEAKWIENNASEYGFVESYPLGKETITGYMYEPWHYRYVGVDRAKEILKSGKTTIEYLQSIK